MTNLIALRCPTCGPTKKWISIAIITLAIACILCTLFSIVSGPELVVPGATTKKNVTANILVYEDLNGDGQQNNNEGPIANTLIIAQSNIHGGFTRHALLSDANGQATVTVTYTHYFDVGVLAPCGYTATTPNSLSVAGAGPFAKHHFGFQPQSRSLPNTINSLHFQLWQDVNGDRQQQTGEPPLPEVTFALVPPLDFSYKYHGFDIDTLALTTDENGQASLDMGNACGDMWAKQPKGWITTMIEPGSLQNDDMTHFTYDQGSTDISWGLRPAHPTRVPTPLPPRFEFTFGGAYHPSGFGEWRVSLDSSGVFSASHQVAEVIDTYGPFTLTRAENKAIRALIQAANIESLPETFQRPGIPDETAYTFSLSDGATTHTAEMWVDEAGQYAGIPPLVEQIGKLVETYTGQKME